jgi:hypothetical protein
MSLSKDRRFEVDGAEAARAFLVKEGNKNEWDHHRLQLQLAWDDIALHSTSSIAAYKEIEVPLVSKGVHDIWEGIVEEFPWDGFKEGVTEAWCEICRTKPATIYDNFVVDFGTKFVPG